MEATPAPWCRGDAFLKHLHPASPLFFGLSFLVSASTRTGVLLGFLSITACGLAFALARHQMLAILRRSRWLLLTMCVLFAWMTPGTWISWLPGITREGLVLAGENLARLLIAIATVAILLRLLPPPALVSGLRSLLAPLALLGDFRDRLAVRLMLTLDAVEAERGSERRLVTDSLMLPVAPMRIPDLVLVAVALAMTGLAVAT